MTPTEQDKELRKAIEEIIIADDYSHGVHMKTIDKMEKLITADRKRVELEARIEPFDFVEPCEPDCDDVRHAYHQGQWDMATRIKAQQEEVLNDTIK